MLEPKNMTKFEMSQLIHKTQIKKILGLDIKGDADLSKMSKQVQFMLRGKSQITMFVVES